MTEILPGVVAVLALILVGSVAAKRVGLPAPVLLAVGGILWSVQTVLPGIVIEPHVVLAVFLPPLLYAEAWNASWHDFRRWLRPILQLAVGLVAFTILCVGLAAKALVPELPWAACFLLGAIVSPTDTVAVHAVLSTLRVPRRITAVLGGESLVNDATGLVGVQIATIVALTGAFEASSIAISFARIVLLGVASGAAVGLLAVGLNAVLRGTPVLFVSSLLAPYVAYAGAEAMHASGILAVVTAGFIASWRLDLIEPDSRVGITGAWELMVFLLNGLMFLFVGLEIPRRLALDGMILEERLWAGLAIAGVAILARLVWFWPAAYLPPLLLPRLRRREGGLPDPRAVMLGGWCGVRGAVSLAAALALPAAVPGRGEIVSAVLVTIAVTLLGQGSTLGPLVRWLRLPRELPSQDEARRAREEMLAAGIARLDAFCMEEKCPIAVFRYRDAMVERQEELRDLDETARNEAASRQAVSRGVRRAVWEAQSAELLRLRDAGAIDDRLHQELQLELDRQHADLAHP